MPSFLRDVAPEGHVRLECGTVLDLARPRWTGPLPADHVAACRRAGVALAYDPAQIGWVLAERQTREEFALRRAAPRAIRPTHLSAVQQQAIRLRPWHQSDLATYVSLLDDPAVWAHMPEAYPDPLTPDLASALIDLSNASNHHEVRAIDTDDGPVGQVRILFEADETLGCAEVSYWLGRAHWGKGLASKAVAQYTDQSFGQHPQVKTLYARVHDENAASARVLEKSGYRHKGPDPSRDGWQLYQRPRSDARLS